MAQTQGESTADGIEQAENQQRDETEQTTTEQEQDSQRGDQDQDQTEKGTDLEKDVEKWRSLSRKNEKAAKENAAAAKAWREYQEQHKTEEQKRQEELEQLTAERDQYRRELEVAKIAREHGLDSEDMEILDGVPLDQLADRAAKYAARVKKRTPSPAAGIGREVPPKRASSDWLRAALSKD